MIILSDYEIFTECYSTLHSLQNIQETQYHEIGIEFLLLYP